MVETLAPAYVVFDGGNSLWKGIGLWKDKDGWLRKEEVMPHAIHEISDARFKNVKARFKGHKDAGDNEWFSIDGHSFVVGGSAEAEGVVTRKTGSAKYVREYYGVSLMAMLRYLMPNGYENIHVYASFPPGDVAYSDDLVNSILGRWRIESSGDQSINYRVRSVQPFDEPLGGYLNNILDIQGKPYKDTFLDHGSTLVIDIGGKVSSVLRVLEGGRVQYGNAKSIDLGIQDVRDIFIDEMKRKHVEVKGLRSFDESIVREAIATGEYQFKGGIIPCAEAVEAATNTILNRLNTYYINDFSGGANDMNILVTGGGGGALFNHLKNAFQHQRMFMAENAEWMHLANARGGERLCKAAVLHEGKKQKAK